MFWREAPSPPYNRGIVQSACRVPLSGCNRKFCTKESILGAYQNLDELVRNYSVYISRGEPTPTSPGELSRPFGIINHPLESTYTWYNLPDVNNRRSEAPGVHRGGSFINATLDGVPRVVPTLLQAHLKSLPPRVEIIPPKQVEILSVQGTDLFQYRSVGVVLGPCTRAVGEQVSSTGRESRWGRYLSPFVRVLPPFHSLITSSVMVGVRVVPRDRAVVELHEGEVAVGTPSRFPEIAPDVSGQGFENLCRC